MDGNITNLPINYMVEDRYSCTDTRDSKDKLSGYWKLDESMYAGAKDEVGNYNGTLLGLTTTGVGNVWTDGLFGNALGLGSSNGRVDFGTVALDSNFSVSFGSIQMIWIPINHAYYPKLEYLV